MKAVVDPIERAFLDGHVIDRALGEAVRAALLIHKRLGNPIAVWRNGRVVWVPPEEIDVEAPDQRTAGHPKRARQRRSARRGARR